MKNVVFMLHHTGTGASAGTALLCAKYGYTLMRIDLLGSLPIGGMVFKNLDEALEDPRFKGWTWIFFEQGSSDLLSGLAHQPDKVIYVYGSDTDGWDRSSEALPGALIHIAPNESHTQAFCSETTIQHRYYQVDAP